MDNTAEFMVERMTGMSQKVFTLSEDEFNNFLVRLDEPARNIPTLQKLINTKPEWDTPQTEWQPIETAPKDQRVLFYFPEYGSSVGVMVEYEEDQYKAIAEFMFGGYGVICPTEATNWMPLPTPPEVKS